MINSIIYWTVLIVLAVNACERYASEKAAQEECQAKQKAAIYTNHRWYCVPGEKL
jgi:hypothetical protein